MEEVTALLCSRYLIIEFSAAGIVISGCSWLESGFSGVTGR
jgi:hypothetical protein